MRFIVIAIAVLALAACESHSVRPGFGKDQKECFRETHVPADVPIVYAQAYKTSQVSSCMKAKGY